MFIRDLQIDKKLAPDRLGSAKGAVEVLALVIRIFDALLPYRLNFGGNNYCLILRASSPSYFYTMRGMGG